MATANLSTTVQIEWQDYRGHDRECEVEVDFTFDGDDLRIIKTNALGFIDLGYDSDLFDELVWEAVNEGADEAYGEWLADRGDYLFEQARDRAAEAYIPAGAL